MDATNMTHGRKRLLLCAGLLGLSLLLIGAGRMNGEIKSRQAMLQEIKAECQTAAVQMSGGIPLENRKAWETAAAGSPALLLKASSGSLRQVSAGK